MPGVRRVTNTAYVYAQQFQLGAKVCTFKGVFATKNMVNGDLRVCSLVLPDQIHGCSSLRIHRWRRYPDRVWQESFMTIPPRGATSRPHWVASLSRGRIPVEKTIKSTSSSLPSAKRMVLRASTPSCTISRVFCWCERARPYFFDFATQLLAAHLIKLFRHQHGGQIWSGRSGDHGERAV